MKAFLKTIITRRAALITLIGCVLSFSIFFFIIRGRNSTTDMSNSIHPYLSEKELKSTEPIEVDPFPEPSLERLSAVLKTELGLTRMETAETTEMIARERFMDNINYMDSRRDENTRHSEWNRRKRQVIAKPELLWTPGFILPPTIDVTDLKDSDLYNYDIKGDPKVTKAQNKRIRKRQTRWQNGEITALEYRRSWAEILSETNDSLTIAKVLRNYGGIGSVASQVALKYAELATAENPDSFEAHHVWALCNYSYYYETDYKKVISGFRQLVERFPNSSIANFEMAWILAPVVPVLSASPLQKMETETALVYLKRAIQLDNRIAPNNSLLAKCYFSLGEYEKALAVYQGMSEVFFGQMGGLVTFIYHAQEEVFKLRNK